MSNLNNIRAELAAIAPNYQVPIPGFPPTAPAWAMRGDAQTSAVFFCLHVQLNPTAYEEFANIRLETKDIHVNGALRNCLLLVCLDHSQREKFSLICDDFLDPAKRNQIAQNPAQWWSEWSELLGNSVSEQCPHSVLGELMVWNRMFQINQVMSWSGPDSASHDLVGTHFDIEVKSTIQRYGKRVTISGEHQLAVANGKRLFLVFMRFEDGVGNNSINSLKADLLQRGASGVDIENKLDKMKYQSGKSTRSKTYMLHDAEVYEVTNAFPSITPANFIGGVTPRGIEQIKYEIDLSLLQTVNTVDQFVP
jgi:hypothetical protein